MLAQSKEGYGHKFVPTGLTYFTDPTTYQYKHLNSGMMFRSSYNVPEEAGADWLALLDANNYVNKRQKQKL
jgi:hypothetical protein